MLASGTVVLAALCGFVVGQGDPSILINIEKMDVINTDNPMLGKWTTTINPGKPVNKVSMKTPVIGDIPAELMMKFVAEVNNSPLPSVESTACEALKDEMVGKSVVAAGNPFPKGCPISKGEYAFFDYMVDKKKIPPGIPDGELKITIQFYMPGKPSILTITAEGTISHDVPTMG